MFNENDPRVHPTQFSEIAKVTVWWVGIEKTEYITPLCDLVKFLHATLRLHFDPCVNPHSGIKSAKASCINVDRFGFFGQYWWSTPNLNGSEDTDQGARIMQWSEIAFAELNLSDKVEPVIEKICEQVEYSTGINLRTLSPSYKDTPCNSETT